MSRQDRKADEVQALVTRRYDRNSRFYDIYDLPMDLMGGRKRRKRVLSGAHGKVLEVGVGTGRNLGLYPADVDLTGIDISTGMLARAKRRAQKKGSDVRLEIADVHRLPFPDDTFDTATATCVFCSVADPVQGLRELRRVVKPDGTVLLLEHVRPRNRFFGWLADKVSPLARRLVGPEINRRTEENVAAAGLEAVDVRREGVWREIAASPSPTPQSPVGASDGPPLAETRRT